MTEPEFPRLGVEWAPTLQFGAKTHYLARFLHENERNRTGKGRVAKTSLGSANGLFLRVSSFRYYPQFSLGTCLARCIFRMTFLSSRMELSKLVSLAFLFLFAGIGVVINYISVFTVFLQNFTTEYGGRGAVAVALGMTCSVSFVSENYLHL